MKTRVGFVSNSSSTSFLVSLPYEAKTEHKLGRLLFDRVIEEHEISFEHTIVKFLFKNIKQPVIFKTKDEVMAYFKKEKKKEYGNAYFNEKWNQEKMDRTEQKYHPTHYFIYSWNVSDSGPMEECYVHDNDGDVFGDFSNISISGH